MSSAPQITMAVGGAEIQRPAGRSSWLLRARQRVQPALAYALADQVVYSFGNMVCAALISRHGDVGEFGIYILTQRALDVVLQVCNVFLWAPFTFQLPKIEGEAEAGYRGNVLVAQGLACFLVTLLFGLAWLAARATNVAVLEKTLRPLIATAGLIVFRECTRRLYFANMRFRAAFWAEAATVTLQIAGFVELSRAGYLNVSTGLLVLAAGCAVVNVAWFVTEWSQWCWAKASFKSDMRRDFALGRWLCGSNMIALAGAQLNPWLLGTVLGSGWVGRYAISESVVNIPRVALNSLQNAMAPMIARAESQNGKRGVARAVRRMNLSLLVGSALCALVIWAIAPWVARLIFKDAPVGTRTVAGLLALNLVVFACTLAQSYGLTALRKAETTVYANGMGALVQVLVSLPLIRAFSLPGAAVALICGNTTVLVTRQFFWRKAVADTC